MNGKKVGYVRVSSLDQNYQRQLEGIVLDKCFIDKASGRDILRPQLKEMLGYLREGDCLIVHSMDRLARNLDDLRKLVQELTSQNISIRFIKEGLTFTNEDNPMSKLLLSMMGAFAEFERALIKERQREGITLAKRKGLYKGRKPSLTLDEIEQLKERVLHGENKTAIAASFNISRETLYRYIRNHK